MEIAHRNGVLNAASLMVNGPAVADAVRRARAMPSLRVGLHVVVIEGKAALPARAIPDLVRPDGWFGSDQLRRGAAYFLRPDVRVQLAREIEAQFAVFASTGLKLCHADAHKHMQLHPTIGAMMIAIGRRFGLTRLRVPAEPPAVLAACGASAGLGAAALYYWSRVLRRQVRCAGMQAADHVFGLHWSGHMTADRILSLLQRLPRGVCEIYSHPAAGQDSLLARLMPRYDPVGELAALCDPRVKHAVLCA